MRVLVTGGAGYIGSHTCKYLSRQGVTPVSFDNLSTGHRWAVRWGPLEVADLLDPTALRRALIEYRVEAVIHFAALALVGESVADPSRYYATNLTGTQHLLDAMRECGVPRLVFSSTCASYGVPKTERISEDHPQSPINPYGHTKLAMEWMIRDYCRAYGLRAVALRYFNAAGADSEGETGEVHDPETHLIPNVLRATQPGQTLTIFGTDYPTPDGTCVRDYIHVEDLARAHWLALERLGIATLAPAYNLGLGRGYSVFEVVSEVERVTGRSVARELSSRRPGDPPCLVADPTRAHADLGWSAQHELETIVRDAWNWFRTR